MSLMLAVPAGSTSSGQYPRAAGGVPTPALRSPSPVPSIPPRPVDAVDGAEFVRRIGHLEALERARAILEQVVAGNVPEFLRHLRPVRLTHRAAGGTITRATVWVTPDYVAVGSDEDFVRVPLGLHTAIAAARAFGMSLPTRKIADAVHRQAAIRLRPRPLRPGPQMTSTEYFVEHNRIIEEQRLGRPLGELISGHKKDLVLSNRLWRQRARVAIYGWHRRDGSPIQPLSTVHRARYADYSHGLRLVASEVEVDGVRRSLFDVIADPRLARVLSYEGVVRVPDELRPTGAGAPD